MRQLYINRLWYDRVAASRTWEIVCIWKDLENLFQTLQQCYDNNLLPEYKIIWPKEIKTSRITWKKTLQGSDGS